MKTINIIKKNRKYFSISIAPNNFLCNLLIDDNSKDLTTGEHVLYLTDISVTTKYGTDYKFKLTCSEEKTKGAGICTLKHDNWNKFLVERCRELNGIWDSEKEIWVFSGIIRDQVEELEDFWNTGYRPRKIKINKAIYSDAEPLYIEGYTIAVGSGRDSGAKNTPVVTVLKGGFTTVGSIKNWSVKAEEGTIIIIELSDGVVNLLDRDIFTVNDVT